MSSSTPPQTHLGEYLSPSEVYDIVKALPAADARRVMRYANRWAHRLPGETGEDLYQEVLTAFLAEDRRWKRGVNPVTSLGMALKSIGLNKRKLLANRMVDAQTPADTIESSSEDSISPVIEVDYRTPEDILECKQELEQIYKRLDDDDDAQLVVLAWCQGLRGEEAAAEAGLDAKTYDAARKRLMRKLDEFRADGEKA